MEKFKFIRDGIEKECHCHEGVYEQLLKEGWEPVGKKPEGINKEDDVISERDDLKLKADALGIEYPKNIKTDKLKELVEAVKE